MKSFIKKLVCFRDIIFDNKAFYVNAVVFLSFLAFSFLSFSILSPIVSSDAATNTATDGNSVYSASFSIDDATPISVVPDALLAVYTGTSTMSYTNTCPYGMSVTLSSSSSDTNLTRNGTDSGIKTIPTISSGTSLSDYTWGYSLDDGATYNGIPGLSSPAIILSTSSANATAATKDIVYGIKTDDQLPSGRYSSIVVYTLSVSPQCIAYNLSWDLNGGTGASGVNYGNQSIAYGDTINLQNYTPTKTGYVFGGWSNGTTTFDPESGTVDVNPSNIPTLTLTAQWLEISMQTFESSMLQNVGDSMQLVDERDGNVYTVKKLADGNVWMTENLKLINKTISSSDSNLPSGETYTVPASNVSSFTTSYNTNSAYLDSTYGGYYNFYTATAGWGTNSVTSGNSPKDICPKGWRLPTGGSSGEFQTLYSNYNSSTLMRGEPNFVLSGYVSGGSVYNQGSYGYFWSSTVDGANDAYRLNLNNSSYVNPSSDGSKSAGFSVRCVAEDRTISDITYMQDMKPEIAENTPVDTAATLTDIRDNNTYTVRKLKDGNVWMTKNLRIAGETITSADSDVTSNFTIPASSASGFRAQDTNNAYVDSAYGGYYTFYTATAGTGGTSLTSGNAPSSICPKGWRLPTGGSSGEFNTLYGQYNSAALMMGIPNFTLPGYAYRGSVYNQGSYGSFWSSTVNGANNAYRLYLSSSNVTPADYYSKDAGLSVRCIAISS